MTSPNSSLHDYRIQGPAEVGSCGNVGSFRAERRCDSLPVLLHRFRPSSLLIDRDLAIETSEPPNFTEPFLSRFIAIFEAAGSAYLVEPLPVSVAVDDVWRCVLLESPEASLAVLGAMVEQVSSVIASSAEAGARHGAVCVSNLVLTRYATYGVLAGHVDSRAGPIRIRPSDDPSDEATEFGDLARLLDRLLQMETDMAVVLGRQLLPPTHRQQIEQILSANSSWHQIPGQAFTQTIQQAADLSICVHKEN